MRLIRRFGARLVMAGALLIGVAMFGPAAPAMADTQQVCAPNKCITISDDQYCLPDGSERCGSYRFTPYQPDNPTAYCSQSFGCFQINGSNFTLAGGPMPTEAEQNAIAQCLVAIGGTAATVASGGTLGWTLFGATTAAWGCASI